MGAPAKGISNLPRRGIDTLAFFRSRGIFWALSVMPLKGGRPNFGDLRILP